MNYTIDNAKWTDYGWEDNIFMFQFGDFIDEDGDDFFFRVEYRTETRSWHFYMEYEEDELTYCNSKNEREFFLRHMNQDIMEATKIYMEKLMK